MTPTTREAPPTTPPSDAWIAKDPGDKLHGVVVDTDTAWSDWRAKANKADPNAGWYPLLTVKTDDGAEVKLHGFRTVLYNELMRHQPIVGERITVTFKGEGRAKDGMNAPLLYDVRVEGRVGGGDIYAKLNPGSGPAGGAAAPRSDVPSDLPDESDLPF